LKKESEEKSEKENKRRGKRNRLCKGMDLQNKSCRLRHITRANGWGSSAKGKT